VFAVVLMLRGFVGAEEERVVWWGKDGFVGTKDWMLLYVENGPPVTVTCVSTRAYE
jgi:Na+-transporting NADH:ubiquinone oxidoreductase subunit NqrB